MRLMDNEREMTANPAPGFDEAMASYLDALLSYLVEPTGPRLCVAGRLGGVALNNGMGPSEMASIHHEALKSLLSGIFGDEMPATPDSAARWEQLHRLRMLLPSPTLQESTAMKAAESFFRQSLWPFEVSHRRVQESVAALDRQNSALEEVAKRISHALYDDTLQLLAAARLVLHRVAAQFPPGGNAALSQAGALLDQIGAQLEAFSYELRPFILDYALDATVRTMADRFSKSVGIGVAVETMPAGALSCSFATMFYRAIEEALANISAHSHATHASIRLERDGETITCIVRDDGVGFEPHQVFAARGGRGLGLIGIRESIRRFGGTLAVDSSPNWGTELRISAPRNRPSSTLPAQYWLETDAPPTGFTS